MTAGPGGLPPILPTVAQWYIGERYRKGDHDNDGMPYREARRKLAHAGPLTQFAYGSRTTSAMRVRPRYWCVVCTPHTGLAAVGVDHPELFSGTRTAQFIGRRDAAHVHGDRYHVWIDFRGLPRELWPRDGHIAGADVISNGWSPLPGGAHPDGTEYAPARPDGLTTILAGTPDMAAAISADRADFDAANPHHHGGGGGTAGGGRGHDGEVARLTLAATIRHMAAGLDGPELEAAVRADWLRFAAPLNPADPYTLDRDFPRHYSRAPGKARARLAAEAADVAGFIAWYERRPLPPRRARRVPGYRPRRKAGRAS